MDNSQKNYTPISIDGARRGSSFRALFSNKKNLGIIGGVVTLALVLGVTTTSLQNRQTLTTPAQTFNDTLVACPDGYKKIDIPATNADGTSVDPNSVINPEILQKQCPGGDIIIIDDKIVADTAVDAKGNPIGSNDGSNVIIGDGDGDKGGGDTVPGQIVCCRPQITPEDQVTPPDKEITPVDGEPTPPPDACFIPELQILEVELQCPDCTPQ